MERIRESDGYKEKKKRYELKRKASHLRLLLPCFLAAVLVLDGLTGYTAPDPFDGLEAPAQTAYAAEAPKLEVKAQTGKKITGKGPASKLGQVDEPGEYKDGTYTGSAAGFGGPITVEVTVRGGKIVNVRILSAPGETSSYLSRASVLLNRIVKMNSTNVDAVSGATYSSNGIIQAVRNALKKAQKKTTGKKKKKKSAKKDRTSGKASRQPVRPAPAAAGKWKDGIYTGEGEGFGGKLHVQVTVKDGKIISIELLDNKDGSDFMSKAKSGIFPAVISRQSTDVDAVTGATFSSYGLIEAINDALKKAVISEDTGDSPGEDTDQDNGNGPDDSGGGGTGTYSGDEDPDKVYKDGTYSLTAACSRDGWFDYDINITIEISGGQICSMSVSKGDDRTEDEDDREENGEYLSMAANGYGSRKGMIDKILDAQSADVDSVTGATYSSSAIRNSIAGLLSDLWTEKKDQEEASETGAEATETATADPAEGSGPGAETLPAEDSPPEITEDRSEAQEDEDAAENGDGETPAPASDEASEDTAAEEAEIAEEEAEEPRETDDKKDPDASPDAALPETDEGEEKD